MNRCRCIVAVALLAIITQSSAQQADAPNTTSREEFVLGNAQFVLLHELAHLIIGDKMIPIIGPEESAADYLAAMMLIRPPFPPPEDERLLEYALNTADGFSIAWEWGTSLGAVVPYWGAHTLTVQRLYTVSCLLYGSDPSRFERLPEVVDMPIARARSCPGEFEKAARGTDWLFETYGKKENDPPGWPVEIILEPPPTRTSARLLDFMQKRNFIGNTFTRLDEFFVLEQPVTFVMRSCREAQAAWMPDTRELVFCYELLDIYYLLGRDQHREAIESLLGE